MNTWNNPALEQKKQDMLLKQLSDHQKQDRSADILLKLGMVLTFGFYLMFGMNLYLGDPLTWSHYFETVQSTVGFTFMVLLVFGLALFLAWVKHHAYIYFGLYGSITLIVATVISFALFAEFFTASANQDAKSQIMLKNNAAYQSTLSSQAPTAQIGSPALATQIARAQQIVARCEEKLRAGKEKHCQGDKARLQALLDSEARTLQQQQAASVEQQRLNHARQDKLKADSYNPAIVAVARFISNNGSDYGDHIKTAIILVMLFVAISFEILHHFLSTAKARAHNAVMAMELEVAKAGGTLSQPAEAVQPATSEHPEQGKSQWTPPGAKPTTAQQLEKPVFKYQQNRTKNKPEYRGDKIMHQTINRQLEPGDSTKKGFTGFIDTNNMKKKTPPALVNALPEAKALETGQRPKAERQPTPLHGKNDWQFPLYLSKALATGKANSAQETQAFLDQAKHGTYPVQNPARRVEQGENRVNQPAKKQASKPVKQGNHLYVEWRNWVEKQAPKYVTVDASRRWVQKQIAADQRSKETATPAEISNVTKLFYSRAALDKNSRIKLNPKYRNGARKYVM